MTLSAAMSASSAFTEMWSAFPRSLSPTVNCTGTAPLFNLLAWTLLSFRSSDKAAPGLLGLHLVSQEPNFDAPEKTAQNSPVCNLYSITTDQAAIAALFRVVNRYVGNLAPMPGVFPDHPAPVVRNINTGRELSMMRWGMPPPPRTGGPPVTNVRNTSSPHWRGWLKAEWRCGPSPSARHTQTLPPRGLVNRQRRR